MPSVSAPSFHTQLFAPVCSSSPRMKPCTMLCPPASTAYGNGGKLSRATFTALASGENIQVNRGIDSTILLRDVINGNSVESHVPIFSPLVESIEVGRERENGSRCQAVNLGCLFCFFLQTSNYVRVVSKSTSMILDLLILIEL